MNALRALLVAAVVAVPSASQAEKLDLGTTKCKQFSEMSKEKVSSITTWLIAYYMDEGDPEVIDFDRVKDVSEKILNFCSKNPNFTLSSAAEGILTK